MKIKKMKKDLFSTLFLLFGVTFCSAQSDTVFLNNKKIPCTVNEITQDAVKFSYPGEDLTNTIYKNAVQKIIFKNGRVQSFSESTSYKKVESVEDYENVSITQVESEVSGLFKIGEVSSKAKGTTTFSNQERVKQRAYRKLKIEAAMMGANIVYVTNQRTEGNKIGGYWQSGSTSEANLSGVAYSNKIPNYEEFISLIGDKRNFSTIGLINMWSGASDYSKSFYEKDFTIKAVNNENGLIMIDGTIKGIRNYNKFRVVSFNENSFNVFYEDKSNSYNISIKL